MFKLYSSSVCLTFFFSYSEILPKGLDNSSNNIIFRKETTFLMVQNTFRQFCHRQLEFYTKYTWLTYSVTENNNECDITLLWCMTFQTHLLASYLPWAFVFKNKFFPCRTQSSQDSGSWPYKGNLVLLTVGSGYQYISTLFLHFILAFKPLSLKSVVWLLKGTCSNNWLVCYSVGL